MTTIAVSSQSRFRHDSFQPSMGHYPQGGPRARSKAGLSARSRTACLLACVCAFLVRPSSATTVYLPAPGALTFLAVTGATTGTPIVVTVSGSAPANGTALWIHDVGGQLCANGFWITAGASLSSFQLTYMYYGGNAAGTTSNCTGTYNGGGTAVVLTAYTLAAHPRVFLDGPSGSLATSLQLTGSTNKSNANNPPYNGLLNAYNSWVSTYQNADADQTDSPWCCYMQRYATGGLLYWATGNASYETVADWGVDHVEQAMGSPNNFYCAGDNCSNTNQANYVTPSLVPLMQAYSIIHSQLTQSEIQNFKDKILNDSAYLKNGLGVNETSANPLTQSCLNSNWSTWVDSNNNCGMIFYSRNMTYSPTMAPGQEGHYTADYAALNPTSSQSGIWDVWPHGDNLTLSKLYGYIAAGLALADDDVRARVLLTQSYTYWYRWYWAYATSGWTPRNQGSRYTSFNVGTQPAAIAAMMKNSCGLDLSGGNWLKNFLQFVQYQALPGWPSSYSYMDQWGDVYTPDNNQIDWAGVFAVPMWLYNGTTDAQYANYFMNHTMTYSAGQFGGESFPSAFLPYIFADPGYGQTNYSVATTQRLFEDTDYTACTTAFGTTPASGNTSSGGGTQGCYPSTVYGGAISKSDWTTTATQMNVQVSFNQDNYDHSGCGLWGSYHIYRKDYLLAGDATGANTAPNGGAHSDCTGAAATDILIDIGAGDNWNTSGGTITSGGTGWAYATIPRWASADPTGDASSRYMYLLADVTPSYVPRVNATRVQRHLIHFKKPGNQDYIVSYDDVALSSGNQIWDQMWYWNSPSSGQQTITANPSARTVVSSNSTVGNFLASSFFPVAGSNTVAMIASGVAGSTNRNYLCPSTNGSSCSTNATSFEAAIVHKPSTSPSDAMPTISQPSCTGTGGNCTVVDIQDGSYPKVAAFARQGAWLTGLSFTSTHSGTAQYLIAGLSAGTYTVTVGGNTVSGSPFTVNPGDNTLYFESTSGTYNVTQSSGTGGGTGPAIGSFIATPSSIPAGQSSTLSWTVTGSPTPTVSISPGVGQVSGSSVNVSPSVTTVYTLTAVNSAGTASANVTVTVTPTAPTNLSATAVSSSQINLSWTASTDNVPIAGYKVYRGGAQIAITTATSYSDTGLAAATTYTYTVAAYDAAGDVSPQSAPASATTLGTGAQGPVISAFSATPATIVAGQSSTLSWSVSGSPAPSLSINNGVGNVSGQTSVSVYPTATTTYTLTATNSAGTASANATITVNPDTTPPSVPTNLVATAESASAIGLSWSASTDPVGVAGYNVYRNAVQVGTTTATAYTDSGLTAATTYTYTVAAYDAAGNVSAPSAPASATTFAWTSLGGCPVFPSTSIWNTPAANLPVDVNSAAYINTIGSSTPLHPDFSSTGGGIPYNIVAASQPLVNITFSDNSQGDPGRYPVPSNALVESGSDHHVLVLDQGNCTLYELYDASLNADGVTWSASNGAVFNLNSNILRPAGWTSADAAGLPILPGLVKYDEVMSGQIDHALRMTAPQTLDAYIWPATHFASSLTGVQYPPMGQRFRLQANVDVTSFPFEVQVILNALKTYGAFLADNGSSWYLTGAPDSRWDDSTLATISQILGSSMEAVDDSSLQAAPDSASVTGAPLAVSGIYLDQREVGAGATVNADAILTAPAPSGGAELTVASSDPAAVSAPATVTIPAGSVSVPVPITINSISQTTPVVLSSTYSSVDAPSPILVVNGTLGTAVPLLSTLNLSASAVTGGSYLIGTLTLTSAAPSGGTTVALSSSNNLAAATPAKVVVPAGSTTASFLVMTYVQTANALANISAGLNGESLEVGITATAGSVPGLSSLTLSPTTVVGGANVTGTVTLSAPALSGGTIVPLASSNTSVATVPIAITVPASANSATFTVTTYSQKSNTTSVIGATLEGATKRVTVTVKK